ncbi:MAG: hypothetical protein DRO09_00105 [Thermoprotei archaeon]|nr:MAG: hypothetical protein DRO09_00105 [Thermoprotei archaeon]
MNLRLVIARCLQFSSVFAFTDALVEWYFCGNWIAALMLNIVGAVSLVCGSYLEARCYEV